MFIHYFIRSFKYTYNIIYNVVLSILNIQDCPYSCIQYVIHSICDDKNTYIGYTMFDDGDSIHDSVCVCSLSCSYRTRFLVHNLDVPVYGMIELSIQLHTSLFKEQRE